MNAMPDFTKNPEVLIATVTRLFKIDKCSDEVEILSNASIHIKHTDSDNWYGDNTDIYSVYFQMSVEMYAKIDAKREQLENSILNKIQSVIRHYPNKIISYVYITPILISDENWRENIDKTKPEILIEELEDQKNLMISVATGGPRIQIKNDDYKTRQNRINSLLRDLYVVNINPYKDLWDWYGKWSSGDLLTYKSRREYISDLFYKQIDFVKKASTSTKSEIFDEPTGWTRVDRTIGELRKRLEEAETEEQFQAVGLLCRETIISLAQVVYNPIIHKIEGDILPSKTDAKRMLEAYLVVELKGSTNEAARRHAKAALDLANDLTHRRTATFRLAALCAEATSALINIIAIISGQREP